MTMMLPAPLPIQVVLVLLVVVSVQNVVQGLVTRLATTQIRSNTQTQQPQGGVRILFGWVESPDGEWEWSEDNPDYYVAPPTITTTSSSLSAEATPTLPSGAFKPKQSLGQNFLRDGNTVTKILKAFHKDATRYRVTVDKIVELGPGAGALTDPLVKTYGTDVLQCIEIDPRSVELLSEKHPNLLVHHQDVLQVDYPKMAQEVGQPLVVFGNLPYYITSQILFALADASHFGAVDCATVTMQWEVAQRMVASIKTKDYGILSVVFQLYGKHEIGGELCCNLRLPHLHRHTFLSRHKLSFQDSSDRLLSTAQGGFSTCRPPFFGTYRVTREIGRSRPSPLAQSCHDSLWTTTKDGTKQFEKDRSPTVRR
jgi:hypothetical protein